MFNLSKNEKDIIYNFIRNITKTPYYEMNVCHTINHIQKVIMFSGILAKNENLTLEETKILLAASAFHDSGREGAEGANNNHGIASARQVKKYFDENNNNPFGINENNLAIVQAAIEYHDYNEPKIGETDIEKLISLSNKYGVDRKKNESLIKISELLKDSDALDRARFGRRNESIWSLDVSFLKSNTAKSLSMIKFTEECNYEFNEKAKEDSDIYHYVVPEDVAEQIFEEELESFNDFNKKIMY